MAAHVPVAELHTLLQAIGAPKPPGPTFAGLDHEDPMVFIRKCENFFAAAAIDPVDWTEVVIKYLTDSAAKWFEVYKDLSLPWTKYQSLITQRYAGTSAINRLQVKLYAVKQNDKEQVGVFLQRKYKLALRLLPDAPEEQIVSLLLESIKPSLKKILRAATLTSFEDLFERAVQAETDDAEGHSKSR